MPADPRRRLGQLGEQLAAEHLVRLGFEIVERNYRTRWGELDIVAFDGRTLAFCEVKTRRVSADRRKAFEALPRELELRCIDRTSGEHDPRVRIALAVVRDDPLRRGDAEELQ